MRAPFQAFTLAEVLAAMLFLAIVIPVAVEALQFPASRARSRRARARRRASPTGSWARAWSRPTGAAADRAARIAEGALDFDWTLTTQNWPQDATMQLLTAEVTFPAQGKDYSVKLSTLASLPRTGSRRAERTTMSLR